MINIYERKFVTFLCSGLLTVYIAGMFLLKLLYKCSLNEVVIFSTRNLNLSANLVSSVVFISGFLILFILPGWVLALQWKKRCNIFDQAGLSFMLSIVCLVVLITFIKIDLWGATGQVKFLLMLFFFLAAGLASLWIKKEGGQGDHGADISFRQAQPFLVMILCAIIFLSFFADKLLDRRPVVYDYRENTILSIPLGMQSDELEVFGLADSLKHHFLPYWDLEYADSFGTVFTDPPLYPFISLSSIFFFGESRVSLSLVSIGFVVMLFLFILSEGRKKRILRLLILSVLLISYLYLFIGKNSVFILPEHFFILNVCLSYLFLIRRNYGLFLLFAFSSTLTRFYGIFFVVWGLLSFFFLFKEGRKEIAPVARKYFSGVFCLIVLIGVIGMSNGNLMIYIKTLLIEHFGRFDYSAGLLKYFPEGVVDVTAFDLAGSFQFLLWCLYGTAFLLPLAFLFGKNKSENFFSIIALVYFVLVFMSAYQFPRYVIPLIPLVALSVSSKGERYFLNSKKRELDN